MPTIKIGPHKIPIRFVRNLNVGGKAAFGAYSDDPHLIELDTTLKQRPDQLLSMVIHEALEATVCIYPVKLTHTQIEQLATALTQILRDSKYLRSLLE